MKLLKYQLKIISDLTIDSPSGDGLVILAKGLGLWHILISFLRPVSNKNLIILLNTSANEIELLSKDLGVSFAFLNSETPSSQRANIYLKGGIVSASSRIMIVDMLNKVIPIHLITGIIILNAHQVSDISSDAFILRLFRNENKHGFIKAFSDEPAAFTNGIWKLEKSMKVLYQRFVYLWPRFHLQVKHDIEKKTQVEMIEYRIPMTQTMKHIQQGLWDCLEQCLQELKRSNPSLTTEDFVVDNASFKAFDYLIRHFLDPIWHRVSSKTKNLVQDIKTIRKLLGYLASYDCVTFNSFLETLIASATPSMGFKPNSSNSSWLLLDSAQIVVSSAKKRVYKNKSNKIIQSPGYNNQNLEPILEPQPKWKFLFEIIKEIHEENQNNGPILIMVQEDRTCYQLAEILSTTNFNIVHNHPNSKFNNIVEAPEPEAPVNFSKHGIQSLLERLLKNYLRWKGGMYKIKPVIDEVKEEKDVDNSSKSLKSNLPANKRRRIRGGLSGTGRSSHEMMFNFEEEPIQITELLSQMENPLDTADLEMKNSNHTSIEKLDPKKTIYIRSFSNSSSSVSGYNDFTGQDDSRILEDLKPNYVILFDPDLAFVRRVEIYKAGNPSRNLKVFFMVYDNSIEERKYLSLIRKEKDAFEKLIYEKANMAVPIDQDGRVSATTDNLLWHDFDSRISRTANVTPEVIVDLREFRSSLPSLLHSRRMILKPCTLEVGDYVLSPLMCIERKSITDLVQSLKNGRLYTQAEAMSIHYDIPILLIEFDHGKSFSLTFSREEGFIDTPSKLVLLYMHFPKLRTIWSYNSSFTAEVFEELKKTQPEPIMQKAISAGVDSTNVVDTEYNITSSEVLRSLPGITSKNYRHVMKNVTSISELVDMGLEELQSLIGTEDGRRLFTFINFEMS